MKWFTTTSQLFLIAGFIACATASTSAQTIWYVDASVSSNGDGETWPTAFDNLDDALAESAENDHIWVAQGTYKPTVKANPNDDRSATFTLLNNRHIYGGFAGSETSLNQRVPDLYVTILSGEIGTNPPHDNAYHVVTAANVSTASPSPAATQMRPAGSTRRAADSISLRSPERSSVVVSSGIMHTHEAAAWLYSATRREF